ncbi:hypothetical protein [Halomonas sp. YLGW01]|uniref:hypothetical protein n=1 Tax=Halomonas sp. YLGW01 TaxID=2773308 RepID=UPI00177C920A|nr:hypothetical protein [Halomonas sp. YLGW01]
MNDYVVVLLMVFLVFVGGISANQALDPLNRPLVFRGKAGSLALSLCSSVIMISLFSAISWGFYSFDWYAAIGLILSGFAFSVAVTPHIPTMVLGSALGPIVCSVSLLFLNFYAWGS